MFIINTHHYSRNALMVMVVVAMAVVVMVVTVVVVVVVFTFMPRIKPRALVSNW